MQTSLRPRKARRDHGGTHFILLILEFYYAKLMTSWLHLLFLLIKCQVTPCCVYIDAPAEALYFRTRASALLLAQPTWSLHPNLWTPLLGNLGYVQETTTCLNESGAHPEDYTFSVLWHHRPQTLAHLAHPEDCTSSGLRQPSRN
jgi:hypothetical protein